MYYWRDTSTSDVPPIAPAGWVVNFKVEDAARATSGTHPRWMCRQSLQRNGYLISFFDVSVLYICVEMINILVFLCTVSRAGFPFDPVNIHYYFTLKASFSYYYMICTFKVSYI